MLMLAPTRYSSKPTEVRFFRYGNDQTAIRTFDTTGAAQVTLTVNLDQLDAPAPGPAQIWIKTWSENEGALEAAIAGGIVKAIPDDEMDARRFNVSHNAWAVLADLTDDAIGALLRSRS